MLSQTSRTTIPEARRRWSAGLLSLGLLVGLTGCASSPDETQSAAPTNAATVVEDECVIDPALLSEVTDSDDPSDPDLDSARDSIFDEMDCRAEIVEVAEQGELAVMMYEADHGFTWYPESGELANHGFPVSVNYADGQLIEDIRSLSPNEVDELLEEYIEKNVSADYWEEGRYAIGGWNNPETGDVALDIAFVAESAEEAREMGIENKQIAFFDLQVGASVLTIGGPRPE